MSGPVNLKWSQFSSNSVMCSGLMRSKQIFTDVTLVVDDVEVEAHKFVLASASSVFLSLLHSHQHPHPLILLRGVTYKDLEALLDFMYLGEVSIEQEQLESFFNTAQDLKVKGLVERHKTTETSNNTESNYSQPSQTKPYSEQPPQEIVKCWDENPIPDNSVPNLPRSSTPRKRKVLTRENPFKTYNLSKRLKTNMEGLQPPTTKSSEYKSPQLMEENLNIDAQRKRSGLIQSAINETEQEIEDIVSDYDESLSHEDSNAGNTEDTIAEVEKVLKMSQQLLGNSDPGRKRVKLFNSSVEEVKVSRSPMSKPSFSKDLNCRIPPLGFNSPYGEGLDTSGSRQSSEEDLNLSKKDKDIIAIMLVRKSSKDSNLKCTICKNTFSERVEAEKHVYLNHIKGKLKD